MIPVGIMVSATVLTGNNVGANRIPVARAYALMCVKTGAIWAFGTVILLFAIQGPFIEIFTNSTPVKELISDAYPVMLCYVFFDCLQSVGQGIIRGLGK